MKFAASSILGILGILGICNCAHAAQMTIAIQDRLDKEIQNHRAEYKKLKEQEILVCLAVATATQEPTDMYYPEMKDQTAKAEQPLEVPIDLIPKLVDLTPSEREKAENLLNRQTSAQTDLQDQDVKIAAAEFELSISERIYNELIQKDTKSRKTLFGLATAGQITCDLIYPLQVAREKNFADFKAQLVKDYAERDAIVQSGDSSIR